jgi:hypothetical protein
MRDLSWMNLTGKICKYQSIQLEEKIDNIQVLFKPTCQKQSRLIWCDEYELAAVGTSAPASP